VGIDTIGITGTFLVFALLGLAAIIFLKTLLPETGKRSLEELEGGIRGRRLPLISSLVPDRGQARTPSGSRADTATSPARVGRAGWERHPGGGSQSTGSSAVIDKFLSLISPRSSADHSTVAGPGRRPHEQPTAYFCKVHNIARKREKRHE
jgi:hypothetical protein